MRVEKCGTCRFWDDTRELADEGVCRRHAPQATVTPDDDEHGFNLFPSWPLTLAAEWCGEYQPAPVPPGSAG